MKIPYLGPAGIDEPRNPALMGTTGAQIKRGARLAIADRRCQKPRDF
jgi:hypothetical protein